MIKFLAKIAEKYDYDHPIPMDEDFVSSIGGSGPYPGALGEAADDINCRCRMRSRIISPEEYEARFGSSVLKEREKEDKDKGVEDKDGSPVQITLKDLPEPEVKHTGYSLLNTSETKLRYDDLYQISEKTDGSESYNAHKSYIATGHSQMNRYLRKGEDYLKEMGYTDSMIQEFKKDCEALIAPMEKQDPIDAGLTFYRGLGKESGKALLELADGEPYRDKGFQSFSIFSHIATDFSHNTGLDVGKTQEVIIRGITNGKQKGIAGLPGEHEIIFAPGTEWQVVGRELLKGEKENHPDFILVTVIGI